MSPEEFSTIVDETVSELEVMAFCGKQSNDNYLKVCFESSYYWFSLCDIPSLNRPRHTQYRVVKPRFQAQYVILYK